MNVERMKAPMPFPIQAPMRKQGENAACVPTDSRFSHGLIPRRVWIGLAIEHPPARAWGLP